MPGRDGTGPMGAGPMSGRGMGFCTGHAAMHGGGRGRYCGPGFACGHGLGYGFGRGFGRGFDFDGADPEIQKDFLSKQRDFLKARLDTVEEQLGKL